MTTKKEPSKRSTAAAKTINAYRRLFSTEDGQIVLKDLMNSCGFARGIIGRDVQETYFNEGRRSVILGLIGTINMETKQVERLVVEMNREAEDMVFN